MSDSFDPIWEELYLSGHEQRAPWDETVTFVFRNIPRGKSRQEIKILEVGCGTASNLWFFALEGFDVTGIDASASAIAKARTRFDKEGLSAELHVGNFARLPYDDSSFDLVIDRAALTTCGTTAMQRSIAEIQRVLKRAGKFLFTPYADSDSSYRAGRRADDDLTVDIENGYLKGVGQIRFVSRSDIDLLIPSSEWTMKSIERIETTTMLSAEGLTAAKWRVVGEKI